MIYHNIVLGNDNAEIGSAEYRAPKEDILYVTGTFIAVSF